jgi:hypothetical protein
MKKSVIIVLLVFGFVTLSGQGSFNEFFKTSMSTNKTGMYVLGGWAVANLATGAYGWANTIGSTRYFHQMNFFWNTINLGIAGFSFYSAAQMTPLRMSPQELMEAHNRFENLYLINAGLDIAYMGTGLLLRHLSGNSQKRPDQLMGYGNSVILQGGFLFLFDGVMYLVQRNHRLDFLEDMNLTMMPGGAVLQFSHLF